MTRLPASPSQIEEELLYPALAALLLSDHSDGREPAPAALPGLRLELEPPQWGDDLFEDQVAQYVAPRRTLKWN